MHVGYETVDVFTTVRFGGNPLAVIPDARGLSDAAMQQIATEFNYSETTFVLPPADPQHTAQVRIFTPTAEVPFAGHPNVGTAWVLAQRGTVFGQPMSDGMRFEERAGIVEVSLERENGLIRPLITAPRQLEIGPEVSVATIAGCIALAEADIATNVHMPHVVSVGLPFAVAELVSREALANVKPNPSRFAEANTALALDNHFSFSLFVYVATPNMPHQFSARMFAPLDNVVEDPATGSAAAALAAYRATLLPEADARMALTIEQGVDMGRPSQINLRVNKIAGQVGRVSVGGDCVPVMRGELEI